MTAPAILVKKLSKSFGDTEVLHEIDLEIAEGAATCVIGPSGSGKSTFLRCLAFLEEANSGVIEVFGEPLGFTEDASGRRARLPMSRLRAVRSRLGMVFQQFNLWPHMTALGNVSEALKTVRKLPRAEAEERAMAQLCRIGLESRAGHYPSQLSGGQQQRVAIARALAMAPKVMLFDEVTAALDPETKKEVLVTIQELAGEGMTCILVTHEMGFARRVADRVYFTDGGVIVEDGPPGELLESPREPRTRDFLDKVL